MNQRAIFEVYIDVPVAYRYSAGLLFWAELSAPPIELTQVFAAVVLHTISGWN